MNMVIPKVIFLDVYETLLDMTIVEKKLNALFDSKRAYSLWLELFLQYSFVDNCTVQFHDFTSIASATMQMTSKMFGTNLEVADTEEVLNALKHLPIKEGVQEGLSKLSKMDIRIAALTNAPEKTVCDRMERTGLVSYFEKVLSAEQIKKYKPCLEVYDWAAAKMGIEKSEGLVVTSHGWDIDGAANAGMHTAYIKNRSQMLYPLAPAPDFSCNNLEELADVLLAEFYQPDQSKQN
jgi:2-haloacid dehalogenase